MEKENISMFEILATKWEELGFGCVYEGALKINHFLEVFNATYELLRDYAFKIFFPREILVLSESMYRFCFGKESVCKWLTRTFYEKVFSEIPPSTYPEGVEVAIPGGGQFFIEYGKLKEGIDKLIKLGDKVELKVKHSVNYSGKTYERLCKRWEDLLEDAKHSHESIFAEYDFLDEFVPLFEKSYHILKFFSTRKTIDRCNVQLINRMQDFAYLNGTSEMATSCSTMTMLFLDTIIAINPSLEEPRSADVRYQGDRYTFDFENVRESILGYCSFLNYWCTKDL